MLIQKEVKHKKVIKFAFFRSNFMFAFLLLGLIFLTLWEQNLITFFYTWHNIKYQS